MVLLRVMAGRAALGLLMAASASQAPVAVSATLDVTPGGRDLAAALAAAEPGDVITLAPGLYPGPVVVARPGIVLQGQAGAVVDGGGHGRVISVTAADVTVRGLAIVGSGTVLADTDAGIYLDRGAERALVEANRLQGNLHGVYLNGPPAAVVRDNVIEGSQDPHMSERGNGIHIWNSPGSVVEGNQVRYGRDGIFVTTSARNTFRGNSFRDLRFAVHYMYTNDSVVSDNRSVGNHVGYALMYSHRIRVTGNLSERDRDHGMLFNYTNDAAVMGNVVLDGGNKCVFIYNSHKNRFVGNRFQGCEIGVHFTAGSERNVMTGNAFIGNGTQVKYVGTRWLEWSQDGRGNYWSDSAAFDLDADGIGDTPYKPNDMIDQVVWRHPSAKLLLASPAVALLRWAQEQFPAFHPGGVIDSAPLMQPPDLPAAALEEGEGS